MRVEVCRRQIQWTTQSIFSHCGHETQQQNILDVTICRIFCPLYVFCRPFSVLNQIVSLDFLPILESLIYSPICICLSVRSLASPWTSVCFCVCPYVCPYARQSVDIRCLSVCLSVSTLSLSLFSYNIIAVFKYQVHRTNSQSTFFLFKYVNGIH